MNKSEILKTIEKILIFFPLIFISPLVSAIKLVLFVCWIIAVFIYLYPRFLCNMALWGYEKKGKDYFLKKMALAYKSGRMDPKSAASYSFILLKNGSLEKASEVLDYAELSAFELKNRKKGEMKYNHVHSYRALILWKQDRLDDAVILLRNLLNDGYRTTVLFANLGWFLIKQERLSDALTVNLEALAYDRSNGILDNLALNYYKIGDFKKSRELYEELIERNPLFPDAWFNYGKLLESQGEGEKSQEMYQKALDCEFSFLGTISKDEVEQAVQKL